MLEKTKEEERSLGRSGPGGTGRRKEGRLEGSPFFGADRRSYQLGQELSQPEAQPPPRHKSSLQKSLPEGITESQDEPELGRAWGRFEKLCKAPPCLRMHASILLGLCSG